MPIQYNDSIMDATKHCRENGSLFDVSHMCGLTLKVRVTGIPRWGSLPAVPYWMSHAIDMDTVLALVQGTQRLY